MKSICAVGICLAGILSCSPEKEYLGGGRNVPQDKKQKFPPNPKNLPPISPLPGDDWRQFGHDATRTNVSKEGLDLPLIPAWSYTVEDPVQAVANCVAAAGYVHLHGIAEGNGAGTDSGFRNPWLISLNAMTGEYRGMFSPAKDVTGGHWLAVFEDYNVLYCDDALGAYDCRTFADKRWVSLDRWGPLALDDGLKLVFHLNNVMADADFPLLEASKYNGASQWRQNVWKVKKGEGSIPVHEVNISSGICLAAVRYTGAGKEPPKDGLYAFESNKGDKVWFVEGKFRNLVSTAKRVMALDDAGTLHAYDLRTGKEAWKAELGDCQGTPGLYKDKVVAILSSGDLVAMKVEGKDEGTMAWTVKVEGAAGKSDPDRTAMIMSAQGRALICTADGLAIHELEKGEPVGEWKMDDASRKILGVTPSNPIIARGFVYLCGKTSILALWTGTFLKEQSTFVLKQAETLHKTGKTTDAIKILVALAGVDGLKDAVKKKAQDQLAAVVKDGEKMFDDMTKLKDKKLLNTAKARCDDIAAKFAGTDLSKTASDESAAIAKLLEDPAVASEAGFKEAQLLEEGGKKKEAAKAYKAVAASFPDTEFGKQAAEKYKKLKDYDK